MFEFGEMGGVATAQQVQQVLEILSDRVYLEQDLFLSLQSHHLCNCALVDISKVVLHRYDQDIPTQQCTSFDFA